MFMPSVQTCYVVLVVGHTQPANDGCSFSNVLCNLFCFGMHWTKCLQINRMRLPVQLQLFGVVSQFALYKSNILLGVGHEQKFY